jgi:NADH-quinone oxidoreductase subunit M
MNGLPWLSLIIFTPWIGALALALARRARPLTCRVISLIFSLSTLALALVAAANFAPARAGYQFEEYGPWMSVPNVHYHLGLDGLSLTLVLLTGLVAPVSLLASWKLSRQPRFFGLLFLVLQGSALGVFLALDFFPWFIFWELSLVPAFFLVKLWGGPDAGRAAYQFIVYTLAGSAFLLLGFAAVYSVTGTMDFVQLTKLASSGGLAALLAPGWRTVAFVGVFLGLAVKVPLYPFHTWLPPTYAEAPVGVSMFLTGVMSKMGVYGFLRLLWPLFPAQLQAAAAGLLWLALGGVVLGAFAAIRQNDLKRMVAYSSLNHVSYCLLALFAVAAAGRTPANTGAVAAALSGTILQIFNHGLSAAALFLCVGVLESHSGGRRGLNDFGGLRAVAPVFAAFCGFSMFSSLGLPGLNGFIGEFLIFRGVFGLVPWAAAIACLGLLGTALFLLTFWQRVFHGPPAGASTGGFRDLTRLELVPLVPLVALMLLLGVWPQILLGLFNPLVAAWAGQLPAP